MIKSSQSHVNLVELLEDLAPNFSEDHLEQIFPKSVQKQQKAIKVCLRLLGVNGQKDFVDAGVVQATGPARTLDIGPGMGLLAIALKKLGFHADCLFAPHDYPIPPQFEQNEVGIHYCDTYTEPFPQPDNTYDLITMQEVIEHFHHSPKNCLLEMYRALKPGGWGMIETPNSVNLRDRVRVLLGKSNWPDVKLVYNWGGPFTGHVREYTRDELAWTIKEAGFSDVKVSPVNRVLWQSEYKGRDSTGRMVKKYRNCFRVNSPYAIARLVYFLPVLAVPNLRDTLLATFRKPT